VRKHETKEACFFEILLHSTPPKFLLRQSLSSPNTRIAKLKLIGRSLLQLLSDAIVNRDEEGPSKCPEEGQDGQAR
jgi:hypothetical protein